MKRTFFIFVFLFMIGSFLILMGQQERPVKIAVASEGETINSQVSNQGARCGWFLLFDKDGALVETLENSYQQERGGAGTGSAELLVRNEVTIFVAGNVGGKMRSALESGEITFIAFSGTVKDAVAHVLAEINE